MASLIFPLVLNVESNNLKHGNGFLKHIWTLNIDMGYQCYLWVTDEFLELIISLGTAPMLLIEENTISILNTFVCLLLLFITKMGDLYVYYNFPADGSRVSYFKRFNIFCSTSTHKGKMSQ